MKLVTDGKLWAIKDEIIDESNGGFLGFFRTYRAVYFRCPKSSYGGSWAWDCAQEDVWTTKEEAELWFRRLTA